MRFGLCRCVHPLSEHAWSTTSQPACEMALCSSWMRAMTVDDAANGWAATGWDSPACRVSTSVAMPGCGRIVTPSKTVAEWLVVAIPVARSPEFTVVQELAAGGGKHKVTFRPVI